MYLKKGDIFLGVKMNIGTEASPNSRFPALLAVRLELPHQPFFENQVQP